MKRILFAIFVLGLTASAYAAGPGDLPARYDAAMRRYAAHDYPAAAAAFRAIADADEKDPLTLKAHYFLARSLMKNRSWRDAQREFFAIYNISSSFYAEWGCDFLLGECRRALGEDR